MTNIFQRFSETLRGERRATAQKPAAQVDHQLFRNNVAGWRPERLQQATYPTSARSLTVPNVSMEFIKPWEHELVLFGESYEDAAKVMELMRHRLAVEKGRGSYQETMEGLIARATREALGPDKTPWSPTFRVHQLRYSGNVAEGAEEIRATVLHCLRTGAPLEFGYKTQRQLRLQGTKGRASVERLPQTNVRRMNVLQVDETGFLARHARGTRRFSFPLVAWAVAEGSRPVRVLHEPMIRVVLKPGKSGDLSATLQFGSMGDNGEFRPYFAFFANH